MICRYCKGTGRILLLTSSVECHCKVIPRTCKECSYDYCECEGNCNEDNAGSCSRCEVWCCEYCLVDGMCSNCYAKLQGGVA